MHTKITTFTIAIALIMLSSVSCKKDTGEPDIESGIKIGNKAPDFSLPDKDGNILSLYDINNDLKLVTFWASWCHYCREENPELVSLYNNYQNKGLEIIGISIDTNRDNWLTAVSNDGIEYLQVSDLLGTESPVYSAYGVLGVPKMFLLNKDNEIIMITSDATVIEDIVADKLR